MPLPLIAVVALWFAGATGAGVGANGVHRMKCADDAQKKATNRFEEAQAAFDSERRAAQWHCERYGRYQMEVQRDTLGGWADWLATNEKNVRMLDGEHLSAFQVEMPSLPELQFQVAEAEGLLVGGVTAVVAGMVARQAALSGVRMAATAGTGAAISGLSGAAAENAILAWLGGGTLASGGGGVTGGATVLGGLAIAPALLIAGCTLGAQGHKAQTKAQMHVSNVQIAIEHMASAEEILKRARARLRELRRAVTRMDRAANKALHDLASVPFDPRVHAKQLLRTAQLMRALRELLNTPIFNDDGTVAESGIAVSTIMEESA